MKATTVFLVTLLATAQSYWIDYNLEELYSSYKLIEDAVLSDPKANFKIEQMFFPNVNYRSWQVDGAEFVPILAHLMFQDEPESFTTMKCNTTKDIIHFAFMWTNSLLMSLIPGDILLAMDNTITTILYSVIVGSSSIRWLNLTLCLNRSSPLSQTAVDDLEQAMALFLSQIKTKVAPKSETRFPGYIAKRYRYFATDSYFSKLATSKAHITNIQLLLWITFGTLNLLIPILLIKGRKEIISWLLMKSKAVKSSRQLLINKAVLLAIVVFNAMFMLSTLIVHLRGYPNVLECHLSTATHRCNIPPTATFYNYVLGILITKVVVLPIAVLSELIVALYSVKESQIKQKVRDKKKIQARCFPFVQVFIIWQLLIFVQITVGLISIPLLLLTFVSPLCVLVSVGQMVLISAMLMLILASIPCPGIMCTRKRACLRSCSVTALLVFTTAFICSAYSSYWLIIKNGLDMKGIKGFAVSLTPTILIPLFAWMIKVKFHKKDIELTNVLMKRSKSIDF